MENYDMIKAGVRAIRTGAIRWKNEENPLRYSAPCACGVYLIGNTAFNPITNEELYFVKVGLSTNLEKRMKQYASSNPAVFHIDFMEMSHSEAVCMETIMYFLLVVGTKSGMPMEGNDEWLKVSKEEYLAICDLKFVGLMAYGLEKMDDDFFNGFQAACFEK